MKLPPKTANGIALFVIIVLLSLVLSCASHKSTQPEPAAAPAPEVSTPSPPPAEPAPAKTIQAPAEPPPAKALEAPPQAAVEPAPSKCPPCPQQTSEVQIIGEVEPVTIVKAGLTRPARIDTGATTSSLDARDIQRFERDGKKWVRFTLLDRRSKKEVKVESRLTRTVEITRHGTDPQLRPVVKLKAILGKVRINREFSLTDRSAFTYPVLIGRNFLEGEFIVDVTLKNTATPMSEDAK